MAQEMTYAKALNEAKQVIIQQQYRIKADAEKIKVQQQTILDQSNALSERRTPVAGRARREMQRLCEELRATHSRLNETTTSLGQAEAVVNRQGEKINSLQTTIAELEQRSSDQSREIAELKGERDEMRARLPTQRGHRGAELDGRLPVAPPCHQGTRHTANAAHRPIRPRSPSADSSSHAEAA